MSSKSTFYVYGDGDFFVDYTTFPSFKLARAYAQEAADESGISHHILEEKDIILPSEASEREQGKPLHEQNGVIPGVDFPATLWPERR